MKKRLSFLTLIIAVVCIVACVFCACNSGDIPSGVPVGWESYLEEVATYLANSIAMYKDVINVSINGSIIIDGRYYSITMRANYDCHDYDNSNFAFVLSDSEERVALALMSTNRDTYIDIAQNPYIDNAKLKLQETCFFDWLGGLNEERGAGVAENIKNSFVSIGKVVFKNANINSDRTKYSFSINGDAIGTRLLNYLKSLAIVGDEISSVIMNILGIHDANEIFSLLTSADGVINFHIEGGSISKIDSDRMELDGDKQSDIDLKIAISGEYDKTVEEMLPKTDAGYKVTKVGSTALDGAFSLISSNGDKYAIKYDMSMNTNIDLLKLTFNNFDLDTLSEDNFFHFRLSHKCGDGCTEYCASRLGSAKGAVLDIAYSPAQFGSTNLYINLNLRALLNRYFVEDIARYERSVSAGSIPEYGMIVIPASNLKNGNAFMDLLFAFYSMIMGVEVGDTTFVDIKNLREELKDIRLASVLFDNIFASEEYKIDTFKIKVDENIYGQAREYDIFKEVVYIKAYDEPELKSYASSTLGKNRTAYSWKYEQKKTGTFGAESYILNNIYDADGANLLHGVSEAGYYVPMSDREIADIIGSTVKLEYVGYDGGADSAYCKILAVEGLDPTCFDVQQVTLKVQYPNMLDYTFEFGEITGRILETLFGGGAEVFAQDFVANIKLTRESTDRAFEFVSADTDKKYRLTYNSSVPEFLRATATVKYENGLEKAITAVGESSSVIESIGLFTKQYSVAEWGMVTVKFRVAGRDIERYFEVEKPESFDFILRGATAEIGDSCYITNTVTLRAKYPENTVLVKMELKDFYINDICLDDPSADWGHIYSYSSKYLVFYKSNEYTVVVRKCGTTFGEFTLSITSTSVQKPTYQYTPNSSGEPMNIVLNNERNNFAGTITNKTHGEGDSENSTVDVKVYEYYSIDSGVAYAEASSDVYTLSLAVNSVTAENGSIKINLPAMIINPIAVRFNVTFKKAGIYRVAFRINGASVYAFNITVM